MMRPGIVKFNGGLPIRASISVGIRCANPTYGYNAYCRSGYDPRDGGGRATQEAKAEAR